MGEEYIFQIKTKLDKLGRTKGIDIVISNGEMYSYGQDIEFLSITTFEARPGTAIVGIKVIKGVTTGVTVHKLQKTKILYGIGRQVTAAGINLPKLFCLPLTLQEKLSGTNFELDVMNKEVIIKVDVKNRGNQNIPYLKFYTNRGRV